MIEIVLIFRWKYCIKPTSKEGNDMMNDLCYIFSDSDISVE